MDLEEKSNLSYDYESYASSGECEEKVQPEESECVYAQDGRYDPKIATDEDTKLKNWRKWLKVRNDQQEMLKSKSNRDVRDLVMNTDDVYEKHRNRSLMNLATNYKKFDKYRGDPKFWITPNYIYDGKGKESPVNCPADEIFDRTIINNNEPPTLEYVGLSNLTKLEKGITQIYSGRANANNKSHKCNYFNDRKDVLKYNIDLIDKYSPDLDNLYVHGLSLPIKKSLDEQVFEQVEADTVIIIEGVRGNADVDCAFEDDTRYPILKIQGTILDNVSMIELKGDFEKVIEFRNCSTYQLYSSKILIENVGNICMRYSFEQIDPYTNPNFPLRYSNQLIKRFYFPAIANVCPPGQIIKIPVWFKSKEPGVYHETWKLVLEPQLSKDKLIKFKLQSFVRAEPNVEKLQEIEAFIFQRRATSTAVKLYDELIVDSKLEKPIPYNYLFTKKDIFEHNNPDHFYEFENVQALTKLYEKIPSKREWDLSIITLRNHIINNINILEDKRTYLGELYELSNSLLKSNIKIDINNEKYRCVYQILSSFCNLIEKDSRHLQETYGIGEFANIYKDNLEVIEEELISEEQSKTSLKSIINKSRSSSLNSNKRKKHSAIPHTASLSSESTSTLKIKVSSSQSIDIVDNFEKILEHRKAHYVKTLCVKTYQHLLTAVDEITAVIESLNIFLKPKP